MPALLGGALMTANYYVMSGNALPDLNQGAPFNEGLNLDGLLTLVAMALLPHSAEERGASFAIPSYT